MDLSVLYAIQKLDEVHQKFKSPSLHAYDAAYVCRALDKNVRYKIYPDIGRIEIINWDADGEETRLNRMQVLENELASTFEFRTENGQPYLILQVHGNQVDGEMADETPVRCSEY